MDRLVCAPGGMAAAFKPGSEEWPSLWPFDEFVSAWQSLAAARALISSPFQEAQPCQRLLVTLFVPRSLWRPLRNTFYLLGLAGTLCSPGPATMTAIGLQDYSSRTGDPRVLFNWVLGFHLNHKAEEPWSRRC